MREIFIREENIDLIEHSDYLENIAGKVKMILTTKPGEVLGDPEFGVNLEEMVFTLNYSNYTIKEIIEKQILRYIPEALYIPITVDVGFENKGDVYDICYINVKINNKDKFGIIVKP